jgi:hypothetical protein
MAEVEAGIYAILAADPTVSPLVGTRIYPGMLPQGATLEAIVYQRVSGPREDTLGGVATLVHPRIQIDCFAETYAEAKALATAVRAAFDGYSGAAAGVTIQCVRLLDDADVVDIDPELEGRRRYRIRQDFEVWHVP